MLWIVHDLINGVFDDFLNIFINRLVILKHDTGILNVNRRNSAQGEGVNIFGTNRTIVKIRVEGNELLHQPDNNDFKPVADVFQRNTVDHVILFLHTGLLRFGYTDLIESLPSDNRVIVLSGKECIVWIRTTYF